MLITRRLFTPSLILSVFPHFLAAQTASSVALSTSPNPSVFGAPVTLTAVVTPSGATGRVTFYDGTAVLGVSTVASSQASLTTSLLPSATRSLRAHYSGDIANGASNSNVVSQVVTPVLSGAFQSPVNYGTGSSPAFVAVGDFNSDGKADVAVANQGSNSVSVLLGNGDGTFGAAQSYSVGSQPVSIAVGDFNGDGKPDLAVANAGSDNVSILLGRGDGTFLPAQNLAAPSGPVSLVAVDFNGDGILDLAIAKSNSNNVGVRLGNGDGTFQPETNYAADSGPSCIAVGDFNADGNADLAVANKNSNDVSVLLGKGDGTFQAAAGYTVGSSSWPSAPSFVTVVDFNGDGKQDLLVADRFNSALYLLTGDGTGAFQPTVWAAHGQALSPSALVMADFNGDGDADFATAGGDGVDVAFGTGNGAYLDPLESPYLPHSSPSAAAVADFNGDGRVDLVVTDLATNTVDVLLAGPPPLLSCTPGQLVFNVTDDNQDSMAEACTVASLPSGLSLMFTIPPGSDTWFTTSLSPYITPTTLVATADGVSLRPPGTYGGNVDLWDTGSGTHFRVPVTMSISPSVCTYTLSPTGTSMSWAGGTGSFTVSNDRGCTWTVTSNSSWFTIMADPPVTTGVNVTQTVHYSVAANNQAASRTGTVTIGAQAFMLTQGGTLVPQPRSVSPDSGSGSTQTFTLQYSGAADTVASVWFTQSFGTDQTGSCLLRYASLTNQLTLLADTGLAPPQAAPGTPGSLANNLCSVDTGAATAAWSAGILTLTLPMTFLPSFTGNLQIWMDASGGAGDSGWTPPGTWTVTAPANIVSVVSAKPCCSSGTAQNFAFNYADTSGGGNIQTAWVWFTPAFNQASAAHTCQFYYNVPLHQWNLLDDSGTTWMSATTGGVVLQNSQCSFSTSDASGSSSVLGNSFQLTINQLTFTAAFGGAQQIWAYATASASNNSGWRQVGLFTVSSPLAVVSVQPNSGSGAQQIFQVIFSNQNNDATQMDLLFNATASTANACYVHLWGGSASLVADDGITDIGYLTIGLADTTPQQNSQCVLNISNSSATGDSKDPYTGIYNIELSFKPPFSGTKNIYVSLADSIWSLPLRQFGAWTVPAMPANVVRAVSVAPSSGMGTSTSPTFVYSDAYGVGDLTAVQALFNTSTSTASACFIRVNPVSWTLQLADDTGSVWLGPIQLSSASTLQNSQCIVEGVSTPVASNNTFSLPLLIWFKPAFAGLMNVYGSATGTGGATSGWQLLGTWTTVEPVPSNVSVSPSSGSGSSGTFTFTFADTGGIASLLEVGMEFGTPINPSAGDSDPSYTCFVTYNPSLNLLNLIGDNGGAVGAGQPGSAGVYGNSQCSIDFSRSSAVAGTNLVVTLAVTFRPTYQGVHGIWMQALDANGGGITGMQQEGSWAVSFLPSTVSLNVVPNPAAFGQPVTLTATVSPSAATGTVIFLDGATVLGSAPIASGTASLNTIALTAGTRFLRAHYGGAAPYDFSTSPAVTETVEARPATTFASAGGSPFAAGASPGDVVLGDFNGDGRADLAIANTGANNITVLLGSGSGSFAPAPGSPVTLQYYPTSLAVGDLNGDGVSDLVIPGSASGMIAYLLGNGSGGFTPASYSPFYAGNKPSAIAVADFNGDGKEDLAVANYADNTVSIMLGNWNGGFTAPPGSPVAAGKNPVSLTVGDFNGDGNADLAVADASGSSVTVLLGDGTGGFTKSAVGSFQGNSPTSIVTGDFNGDGKADLAYTNSGSNSVAVLLGDGYGGFTPATGGPFAAGPQPSSVAVGDFNGDGRLDLAIANQGGNSVTVLLGDGSGGFTPMSGSPFPAGAQPASLVVGDFNGDGRADLAIADAGGNNVTVLLGTSVTTGLTSLPAGTVDRAYSAATITAAGGAAPYTWSATGLPPGLSIDPATGMITGAPTTANGSPFLVEVTMTDSRSATVNTSYSLTIFSLCDLNRDTYTDANDVQIVLREALGLATPVHDLNHDSAVNVIDVQIVENAVLGMGCSAQ